MSYFDVRYVISFSLEKAKSENSARYINVWTLNKMSHQFRSGNKERIEFPT